MRVLTESEWLPQQAAHQARVHTLIGDHLTRATAGEAHPVIDFLFTYYSFRPAALRRWHPGFGVVLAGAPAEDYLKYRGYHRTDDGVTVDPAMIHTRARAIRFAAALADATAARSPQFGCFGLHEWAMVYRADETRHAVPLRLGAAGTDAVVEAMPLRCTHFDAYRFFTPDAVPRNTIPLDRATQLDQEQPGCLHANMDLYKWCYKLVPLIDSTLLLDCFELAFAARELDMRASPYDLTHLDYSPVHIETAAGRAEYARAQAVIAARAADLRARLGTRCATLRRTH